METKDVLWFTSLMCLITPLIMAWGISEPQVFYMFEGSWFARTMFLHGLALAGFLYGLSSDEEAGVPLIIELTCFVVSVLWIIKTWSYFFEPYIYTPSTSSMNWWQILRFGVWYLGSAASFIGTAELMKRSWNEIRGLEPKVKSDE